MARLKDRQKAISLRLAGNSYSQIKEKLGISKSTLHYWLVDYPLSEERISQLRDWNARRIEHFRQTFKRKKEERRKIVRERMKKQIGLLSVRELFLAGLLLYWAEGMKVDRNTVSLTNTDPAMLRFFISWLIQCGVSRQKLKARLHLYSDMNIQKQTRFWARELNFPVSTFRNTYVKKSESNKRKNYKGRFGFGTCSVWIHSRDLYELIVMGIDVLRTLPFRKKKVALMQSIDKVVMRA